jgi:NADH-quinone oxidoreductase subunit N
MMERSYPEIQAVVLKQIQESLGYLLPEIFLTILFIIVLVADLFLKNRKTDILTAITLVGLSFNLFIISEQWIAFETHRPYYGPGGMIRLDTFAIFFKMLFVISGIIATLFSWLSPRQVRTSGSGEFYSLLILAITGLNLMVMSGNLLMLYLSAEFVSIAGYIFSILRLDKKASEGSMKYFIFGVASSAFMLYGMSLWYGLTGTLEIEKLLTYSYTIDKPLLAVIIFLTLSGFLFKISLFPFHTWVPDVYQAAPTPVSAFLSVAPKCAGFGVLAIFIQPVAHELLPENLFLIPVIILCFITILAGNFSALLQTDAKRILAYSSIAHAGFAMCGLLSMSEVGVKSMLFYLAVYLPMNFAAFILVDILSEYTGSEDVRKFAGIGKKLPFLGVIFVIIMIALAGLPPTAGFYAKLLIFSALWESFQNTGNQMLLYLLLFGVFNAVVSLFYYLKIPYILFFKESGGTISPTAKIRTAIAAGLAFIITGMFFMPEWLMNYLNNINLNFLRIPL